MRVEGWGGGGGEVGSQRLCCIWEFPGCLVVGDDSALSLPKAG